MARKKTRKVIAYRKPINVNIGMVIFGIIFIYILICVFLYFTSKHIIGYEVKSGSLSVSNVYQGVALREEQTISCNSVGYINYFAREAEHVGVSDLVYTIDESGKIADLIEKSDDNVLLSSDDLNELRNEMINFRHSFHPQDFSSTYEFKYDVKGTALKLSNYNMLSNIDAIVNNGTAGMVNFCSAPASGVIVYNVDGYEKLDPNTISASTFDEKSYKKKQLIGNELVNTDDAAYKLITSENWSLVIPATPERAEQLLSKGYVEVKFLKNQYTSWAMVSVLNNSDGTYVKLDFTNSMITFATDRYIDIEILSNDEEGLKIPNSAIVEKDFYLIPKEYIVKGGNSSKDGFMRESYGEDGTVTTEFVETTLYSETDTDYYVDTSVLRVGDYICKPDSTDKFPVSKVGTLVGVYNINKGYADFKEITILYANEEYSIVKSNTIYGLSVYDHIVLDASSVDEDDFIYE